MFYVVGKDRDVGTIVYAVVNTEYRVEITFSEITGTKLNWEDAQKYLKQAQEQLAGFGDNAWVVSLAIIPCEDSMTAALEHAFKAGFAEGINAANQEGAGTGISEAVAGQYVSEAWSEYDPPEHIKALS